MENESTVSIDAARALRAHIVALGEAEDYAALIAIASEPSTSRLLDMLPRPARQRSDIYLREADHWAQRQRSANRRRLTEAREALDALDVPLAKAVLARIDGGYLDESGIEERDRLILEMESRSMELEELSGTADQVIAAEKPARRRRWRRGD